MGEKEEEKHQCMVASHTPPTGDLTWSATQVCSLTGNQTGDSLVRRPVLNPVSHTSQGLGLPKDTPSKPSLPVGLRLSSLPLLLPEGPQCVLGREELCFLPPPLISVLVPDLSVQSQWPCNLRRPLTKRRFGMGVVAGGMGHH